MTAMFGVSGKLIATVRGGPWVICYGFIVTEHQALRLNEYQLRFRVCPQGLLGHGPRSEEVAW